MEIRFIEVRGYGFERSKFETCCMQNGVGYALHQCRPQALKMNVTWYPVLVSLEAPNKIQPQEYSRGSDIDGIGYIFLLGESER